MVVWELGIIQSSIQYCSEVVHKTVVKNNSKDMICHFVIANTALYLTNVSVDSRFSQTDPEPALNISRILR